jgi:uncharacterized phage-associated protein
MLDALEVARHVVRVGYDPHQPDESVLVCPLRLQKLLYYCQGWSLGLLDHSLFRDPIEAWVRGPVVRSVYEKFQGTKEGITPERAGEPAGQLSKTEAALVEMVWKEYACRPPAQLVAMTHGELPWIEARAGLPATAHSSAKMSPETMRTFFRELARKKTARFTMNGVPFIDPADVWRAEEELERVGGRGTPADVVFSELLARSDPG